MEDKIIYRDTRIVFWNEPESPLSTWDINEDYGDGLAHVDFFIHSEPEREPADIALPGILEGLGWRVGMDAASGSGCAHAGKGPASLRLEPGFACGTVLQNDIPEIAEAIAASPACGSILVEVSVE